MKRVIILISLLILTALSSGCSIVMVAWDDAEDISLVQIGASREVIEDDFGDPVATECIEDKVLNTYEIELEPLGYPSPGDRAFYYIYSDILTFGLFEPWNMYQEAFWEADFKIDITFDSKDGVVAFSEPVCFGDCDSRKWKKNYDKVFSIFHPTPTYSWFPEVRRSPPGPLYPGSTLSQTHGLLE